MIYVIEKQNGVKEKIILPDDAKLATDEDLAYFQSLADEATARRNRQLEAYNISEEILKRERQISRYKALLNKNDYKRGKWIDGFLTDEEYEPVRLQMQEWRVNINALEDEISKLVKQRDALTSQSSVKSQS